MVLIPIHARLLLDQPLLFEPKIHVREKERERERERAPNLAAGRTCTAWISLGGTWPLRVASRSEKMWPTNRVEKLSFRWGTRPFFDALNWWTVGRIPCFQTVLHLFIRFLHQCSCSPCVTWRDHWDHLNIGRASLLKVRSNVKRFIDAGKYQNGDWKRRSSPKWKQINLMFDP